MPLKYNHDPDLMTPEELEEYFRQHPIPPGTPDLNDPTPEQVEAYFERHPNMRRWRDLRPPVSNPASPTTDR